MKNLRHTSLYAALLVSMHVSAQPLSGLLTIDPGAQIELIDPATGTCEINSIGTCTMIYDSGSYFAMGSSDPSASTGIMLRPGLNGGIMLGDYQVFKRGVNGGVRRGNRIIEPFSFFASSAFVGTNPVSLQSGESHPAPSAEVDMSSCVNSVCSITAELSAWEVYWNGSVFEQGPRPDNTGPFVLATGTLNLVTNEYVLDWSSQIKGGSFNGTPGFWHLEGRVVPVPAAVWLFGSGLLGLAGVARKKHNLSLSAK